MKRRQRVWAALPPMSRDELAARYGQVWDTAGLAREFVVTAIIDDMIVVRHRTDKVVGTLTYQNRPRYYYNFVPQEIE